MELNKIKQVIEIINPWIESVVLFLVLLFSIIIIARIGSGIINRLLYYFNIKYDYFPELFEYLIYLAGLVVILFYTGVFKLALIIILGFVSILMLLAVLFNLYRLYPDFTAGRKLAKFKDLSLYGKNYKKGKLNTIYKINDYEKLKVPNKKLFDNLNRSLK